MMFPLGGISAIWSHLRLEPPSGQILLPLPYVGALVLRPGLCWQQGTRRSVLPFCCTCFLSFFYCWNPALNHNSWFGLTLSGIVEICTPWKLFSDHFLQCWSSLWTYILILLCRILFRETFISENLSDSFFDKIYGKVRSNLICNKSLKKLTVYIEPKLVCWGLEHRLWDGTSTPYLTSSHLLITIVGMWNVVVVNPSYSSKWTLILRI